MSLSSIIRQNCKVCNKVAVERSRVKFGTSVLITLECGHVSTEEILVSQDYSSIKSKSGAKLLNYQIAGVKFLESSNGRAILADEQGLGKTIQALALLKLHQKELLPAVIVAKTTIKLQWHHEIIDWCGVQGFVTQVISSGKELAAPGFDIYVVTYDMLKNDNVFKYLEPRAIKTLIIDECQAIKNHLSGRSKAIQKLVKEQEIEHIIPMSGTPIKNNAGEYFTVLNLVQPKVFNNYTRFIENECDSYHNGFAYKIGGLKDPEGFHNKTKDFILRRTKDEVLPDLPTLSRRFHHVELDKKLNKAYAQAMKELEDLMYSEESDSFSSGAAKIAIMTKLRQITGIGKVDNCVDFVSEFLLSNNRKLVIFVHHNIVANMLVSKLNDLCSIGGFAPVLNLHSGLSGDQRAELVQNFKDSSARLMIASTLASGEGLNLQFCSDAVMMERQWNPANEEQAEARFHRFGQTHPVSITYMIASETIDEYFTEIVESKRAIVASTLDNKSIEWDESSLMKELAEILISKGKKAWKL